MLPRYVEEPLPSREFTQAIGSSATKAILSTTAITVRSGPRNNCSIAALLRINSHNSATYSFSDLDVVGVTYRLRKGAL